MQPLLGGLRDARYFRKMGARLIERLARTKSGVHNFEGGRRADWRPDPHGGIANHPGAQKELFKLALYTFSLGAWVKLIGKDLRTDPAHAIVNAEGVSAVAQHAVERRRTCIKVGKRLHSFTIYMVENVELAIGLPPVRQSRVVMVLGSIAAIGKTVGIRSGDDRSQVAVYDLILRPAGSEQGFQHAQDRNAILVHCVVVHNRVAIGGFDIAVRSEYHNRLGDRVPVR